jgi:hypothetical protein
VRRRALSGAPAVALLLLLIGATPALGARLWTLVASPLTMTVGQRTDVFVTSTNLGGLLPGEMIGCVTVFVPSAITVERVWDDDKPGGYDWEASIAPAPGGTLITYRSISGKLGLQQSATFRARVTATAAGAQIWQGTAYDATTCDAGAFPQTDLVFTIALSSSPLPTPTPTPTPTPVATPTPTPSPTPNPTPGPAVTPSPTAPSVSSTPGPAATPGPTASTGPATAPGRLPPSESAAPTASVEPSGPTDPDQLSSGPGAGSGDIAIGSGDGLAGGTGESWLAVPEGDASTGLPADLDVSANGLGGVGVLLWVVPAAALGIPGFLVVLVVLLQAGGGLIWLPVTRRRIGDFGRRSGAPIH